MREPTLPQEFGEGKTKYSIYKADDVISSETLPELTVSLPITGHYSSKVTREDRMTESPEKVVHNSCES